MRYVVPVHVTVDVRHPKNVVEEAKAELQRKFKVSEDEWKERDEPFIEANFGHALGILLCSDAVQGSVKGILETLTKGLEVVGYEVNTTEVMADEEGWARRMRYSDPSEGGEDDSAAAAAGS